MLISFGWQSWCNVERLHPGDLGLLAGDFNDAEPSLHSDFFDAWVESQAHEEGHTFDPTETLGSSGVSKDIHAHVTFLTYSYGGIAIYLCIFGVIFLFFFLLR